MTKRAKCILISLILSLGFVAIILIDNQYRYYSIGLLTVSTPILFYWALRDGMRFDATLLTLVLPTLFTAGVGLFWFLLPTTIFARIPVFLLYGLGIYLLALNANIFNVSAIKKIALMRAARGVGFVYTLLTSFLLFDAILSIRSNIIFVSVATVLVTFFLLLQSLWTSVLGRRVSATVIKYAALLSIGVVQIAIMLFFWPVSVAVGSLFLTVTIYVLLGLGQAEIEGRLFKRTLRDYLVIGAFVFLCVFTFTKWGS